jgi:hypothetical protein
MRKSYIELRKSYIDPLQALAITGFAENKKEAKKLPKMPKGKKGRFFKVFSHDFHGVKTMLFCFLIFKIRRGSFLSAGTFF